MPFDKKKLYFFPLLIKKAKAFFISFSNGVGSKVPKGCFATAVSLLYFSHLNVKNITKAFDFSCAKIKGFATKPFAFWPLLMFSSKTSVVKLPAKLVYY